MLSNMYFICLTQSLKFKIFLYDIKKIKIAICEANFLKNVDDNILFKYFVIY